MHTFILKPKKVPKPEPSILAPPRASPCSADRSAGRGFGIWDFWQVESTERPPPSPRLRMYITGLGISSFEVVKELTVTGFGVLPTRVYR